MKNSFLFFFTILVLSTSQLCFSQNFDWELSLPNLDIEITDSYFEDSQSGRAIGNFYGTVIPFDSIPKTYIIHTENGGDTWGILHEFEVTDQFFRRIEHLNNSNIDFIAGDGGILLRSIDQWQTFDTLFVGMNEDFTGVKFLNSIEGFLVTQEGNILRTWDGGSIWEELNISLNTSFSDIAITINETVVCIGLGILLRSEDQGQTWEEIQIHPTAKLNRISEQMDGTLLIAGDNSFYWESVDDGKTWVQHTLDDSEFQDIKDIVISNCGFGVAVCLGENGLTTSSFYSTKNNGDSWSQDSLLTYFPDVIPSLGKVHYFPDEKLAYVTGGLVSIYTGFLFFAKRKYQCQPTPVGNYSLDGLQVFPNPVGRGHPIIINEIPRNAHIHVFDINGIQIMDIQVEANTKFKIETSNLSSGIYIIKYVMDNQDEYGYVKQIIN